MALMKTNWWGARLALLCYALMLIIVSVPQTSTAHPNAICDNSIHTTFPNTTGLLPTNIGIAGSGKELFVMQVLTSNNTMGICC